MGWKERLACAVAVAWVPSAAAQIPSPDIELDGSLGSTDPVPVIVDGDGFRHYEIPDSLGAYGANGENLYQSFRIFGVPENGSATFTALMGSPDRVVARVTGGERSVVRGLLRNAIDGADLWLLNPSGISFLDGSSVEMTGGSFFASTAHVLRFADGKDLLTIDDDPPVLSIDDPTHFGFLTEFEGVALDTNRIIVRRTELGVPEGQTLMLVGADQPFEGGEIAGVDVAGEVGSLGSPTFRVSGATLNLAAAGAGADVDIPVNLEDLDPSAAAPGELGDVVLDPGTVVLASGTADGTVPSGSVFIRGERFVLDRSRIVSVHRSGDPALGPIDVAVSDSIELGIDADLLSVATGAGSGSPISLAGERISARGGESTQTTIFTNASGETDGPPVTIDGREVTFEGNVLVRSFASGSGDGGPISIAAETFVMKDGTGLALDPTSKAAELRSQAQGSGEDAGTGGALSIAADTVVVQNGAQINSLPTRDSPGGAIGIFGGALEVIDGGRIVTRADGTESGGKLTVDVDSVLVSNATERPDGTFIASIAGEDATAAAPGGDPVTGGDVEILANTVELFDGGQIFAVTEGPLDASALTVDADVVRAHGTVFEEPGGTPEQPSGFATTSREGATGSGGLLTIDARLLFVENAAQISSATLSEASAGDMILRASEGITIEGGEKGASIVSASASPVATGNGGRMEVETGALRLLDGGQMTTSTGGTGNARELVVRADTVEIGGVDPLTGENESGIFSRSNTEGLLPGMAGDGGNIDVRARKIDVFDRGTISVATTGGGNAGAIFAAATDTVTLDNGSISALSIETGSGGDSGAITVEGRRVILKNDSEITARSQGNGLAGNIAIVALESFEARSSSLVTEADKSAGGRITVEAGQSFYMKNAEIETTVFEGAGGGGDVNVSGEVVTLDGASILARASQGAGGNIGIQSEAFLSTTPLIVNGEVVAKGSGPATIIDATSDAGISGDVAINSPDTTLIAKLSKLPANFLDASALLAGPCGARTERAGSFTVVQRASLPVPPDEELPSGDVARGDAAAFGADCTLPEETR